MNQLREIRSGVPWAWADKRTLRFIRKELEKMGEPPRKYILVYHALCEIASDNENAASFNTNFISLAEKTGYGNNGTLKSALDVLNALGVIKIRRRYTVAGKYASNGYQLIDFTFFRDKYSKEIRLKTAQLIEERKYRE